MHAGTSRPVVLPNGPEKDGSDLQRGTPLVLEDVQADAAQLVDVWVVDLREEPDLRGSLSVSMLGVGHCSYGLNC